MIINTNVNALLCYKTIKNSSDSLSKASEKISSGYKINSSGDNPGKFALSNRIKAQLKSIEMADRNNNDAVSLLQTAEGGMGEIQSIILRMRELAVQGSTDILSDEDRNKLQIEIDELVQQIDTISNDCTFNGVNLLNGTFESRQFQTGTYEGQNITLELLNTTAESLGLSEISYETNEDCNEALELCDVALERISTYRSTYGSFQNRFSYIIDSLEVSNLNVQGALSDIIDADIASEMVEYTTQNVLMQTGLSMLAQANKKPEEILNILR